MTTVRANIGNGDAFVEPVSVTLRPARAMDWPTIRRWLARPDIVSWWGPAATTEAEIRIALEAEASAICRIVQVDGVPVGYAQAVDATMWGAALPDDLAPGTWDIDIFIASDAHRGRGVGAAAVAQLKDEVFSSTLALAVCVFPSIENERAVRAYEKAGFRWRRILEEAGGGKSWFMVADRP